MRRSGGEQETNGNECVLSSSYSDHRRDLSRIRVLHDFFPLFPASDFINTIGSQKESIVLVPV